jgi:hypothetical protein
MLGCQSKCWAIASAMTVAMIVAPDAEAAGAECDTPPYRAFDFWLGQWEVTGADGRKAGHNEISRDQGGCVLVERWHGVENSTGMSMSFYDPVVDRWRQVWVSPGIEIDIAGRLVDGSMVLEGTIVYLGDARAHRFRGAWTPLPDGRVRQFFEEANADGEWMPWFDGFYRRAAEPRAPE